MRFKAPPHVTSAHLSIGEIAVDENGFLEVPFGTPTTDIGGLCANGFVLVQTVTLEPAAAEAAKAKPALDLTADDEAKDEAND